MKKCPAQSNRVHYAEYLYVEDTVGMFRDPHFVPLQLFSAISKACRVRLHRRVN